MSVNCPLKSEVIRATSVRGGSQTSTAPIIPRFRLGCTPPLACRRMRSYAEVSASFAYPLYSLHSARTWMAASAWLMVALIRSSATFPRVLPSPYMAISRVPGEYTLKVVFFSATSVTRSCGLSTNGRLTAGLVTHGIEPPRQNSSLLLSGVDPVPMSASSLSARLVHPLHFWEAGRVDVFRVA